MLQNVSTVSHCKLPVLADQNGPEMLPQLSPESLRLCKLQMCHDASTIIHHSNAQERSKHVISSGWRRILNSHISHIQCSACEFFSCSIPMLFAPQQPFTTHEISMMEGSQISLHSCAQANLNQKVPLNQLISLLRCQMPVLQLHSREARSRLTPPCFLLSPDVC